jgi:uncharacterized protein
MKNTRTFAKTETLPGDQAVSALQDDDCLTGADVEDDDDWPEYGSPSKTVGLDPFDTSLLGRGIPNYALDPEQFKDKFPPLATSAELEALDQLVRNEEAVRARMKENQNRSVFYEGKGLESISDPDASWIQTHSGRRFNPLKPNPDAIVIQDVAHALSMQCRFSGHCREFYSVAQHSVLVSYICDHKDALWGLLHDATEAYLVDVPRPLKRSGKLQGYIEIEAVMQEAVCRRFGLPFVEPPSVKIADTKLLATEARDLMSPLHSDWQQPVDPLPFKIEAWEHQKAKDMFMQRFFELTAGPSAKHHYEHYLRYKNVL